MSFKSWLRNLQSVCRIRTTTRKGRRSARCGLSNRLRLHLETLEDRITPSFSPAASFPVGGSPLAVVTGDFNNDGHLDMATANPDAGTVSVLSGNGAGAFGAAIDSALGVFGDYRVSSLMAVDFNNDGQDDVAMVLGENGWGYGYGVVLFSNGDGTFGSPTYPTGASLGLAAGDFNNDGNSDLVVSEVEIWGGDGDDGYVQVLTGNGQGGFAPTSARWLLPIYKEDLTVGDLNSDGNLDVVATDGDFGGTSGVVLLGNGAGRFLSQHDFNLDVSGVIGAAVSDFNGDGVPDLVVAGSGVGTFVGRGDGTFDDPIYHSANSEVQTGLAVADFNGDGRLDVVTSDAYTDTVSLLPGDGDGNLNYAGAFAVGSWVTGIAVGDFNGDGRADVATANGGSYTVSVLLNDGANEQGPWLRISGNWTGSEGNTGTTSASFVVTLSAASTETVTVAYATADASATAGSDYQAASGTLTFAPGETAKTITVLVNGDRDFESGEWFVVNLSDSTNAIIADGQGLGTIWDDEARIHLVPSVRQAEGHTGQTLIKFYVLLPDVQDLPVTVDWATADGSAIAGSDYLASGGTLTFAPGETSKTIDVPVIGDSIFEPEETFVVNLTGATNAIILEGYSEATILNDDPPLPQLNIVDAPVVTEGNTGTRSATFTVTLSGASTQTITVIYATANGTATAGSDFQSASGTLTFAPGQTSKTVTVQVIGDRLPEPNETFVVNLSNPTNATIADGQGSGTIVDDEPRISISDVSKREGKKGQTTQFTFTVTLSVAYDQAVTMSYQTVNGAATTGDTDYVAKNGTLTFKRGETSKTITIDVKGDSKMEADETFYLDLFAGSSNALFTKNRGLGTIMNDD